MSTCIEVAWCKATPLEYFMKCLALNQNFGASWVDTLCDVELTVMLCLTDFLGRHFLVRFFSHTVHKQCPNVKSRICFFRSVLNHLAQSLVTFNCHLSLIARALKDSRNSPDPSPLLRCSVSESSFK